MRGFNDILAEALASYNRVTRGDVIRRMSDDDLADMFLAHDDQTFRHCPSDDEAMKCREDGRELECHDCWLQWLDGEVKVDGEP